MKPLHEKINIKEANGKTSTLNYNEPRPDMDMRPIASRLVELSNVALGHAAIRIRVEQILDHTCGEQRLEKLYAMGEDVQHILIRIARRGVSCSSCGDRKTNAVKALGYFATAESAGFLTALAVNPAEEVGLRCSAILSLGKIGATASFGVMRSLAKAQKSEVLLSAIVTALGMSKSVAALAVLDDVFRTTKNQRLQIHALASLYRLEKFHGIKPGYESEVKRTLRKLSSPGNLQLKKLKNLNP